MSGACLRLLVIEDEPQDAKYIGEILSESSDPVYQIEFADRLSCGLDRLDRGSIDVVLLDMCLPDSRGLETVIQARSRAPRVPFVVLTGNKDEKLGVEAVKEGAQDYLNKQAVDGRVLKRTIQFAMERIKLDNLRDDFISFVSHEIRSPLTVIKASVESLADGIAGELTKRQSDFVKMAYRNAEYLSKVVENMLNLSRLESGKAVIHRVRINSASLLRDTLQNFRGECERRGIELDLDLPGGPPAGGISLPDIDGDTDMVQQVLINLLSNAIRFANKRILVRAMLAGSEFHCDKAGRRLGGVQISLIDDGPGIPADQIGDLFNKFVQIRRVVHSGDYRGTGLGLAICKEIVELHQGKIWAESHPGAGARFTFILPQYSAGSPPTGRPVSMKIENEIERKASCGRE